MRCLEEPPEVYVYKAVRAGLNEYVKGKLLRVEKAVDYSRLRK